MKKLGILCFTAGIIIMLIAAVNFGRERKMGSINDVKNTPTAFPFPWFPTTGAILIAGGIIMIVTGKRKKA